MTIQNLPKRPTLQQPLTTTDPSAFGVPGVVLVVDPDDAEDLGAFPETALDAQAAWESSSDDESGK